MSAEALATAAKQGAAVVRKAQALLVTAGAGMGVDSGLPDFRGTKGLWAEYPPLKEMGLNFADMASPSWFEQDPCFAWGFYGHRLQLYRRTEPHQGFGLLRRWAGQKSHGHFAFTSNVDGQFQRAQFSEDRVVECHGSIHFLQGLDGGPIEPADGISLPEVDPSTLRVPEADLPRLSTGEEARPNILMFGDGAWEGTRTGRQQREFARWLRDVKDSHARLVIVELGAGGAVPTVRRTSEALARQFGASLVRINPREAQIPKGLDGVSIATGALEGLMAIDKELAYPGAAGDE